ncbi:MAG: hypothetical protein OJI67_10590 [Prosthecobacter sp.]|nr:hypothetical protein [Prosthecobacter sp.]
MRQPITKERINRFMIELGKVVQGSGTVFFTGGVSAVLMGWREMTVDVDFKAEPEPTGFYEALPPLKDKFDINLEPASPSDFIPVLPGWRERCRFIGREGSIDFYHYDFYSQALAKIERSHDRDRLDVANMIESGLVDKGRMLSLFQSIEPMLIRYPAVAPRAFAKRVQEICHEDS